MYNFSNCSFCFLRELWPDFDNFRQIFMCLQQISKAPDTVDKFAFRKYFIKRAFRGFGQWTHNSLLICSNPTGPIQNDSFNVSIKGDLSGTFSLIAFFVVFRTSY